MKKLAIITARGGSKRIPRKNIKDFLGKPIIAYSIETALRSGLFDEVMVSTDDNEIAEIAKMYGASIPFMRSGENSDDFATTADVIAEVLSNYDLGEYRYACCIYPTAPLVSKDVIKLAFEKLKKNCLDTAFPVVKFSYPVQRSLIINNNKVEMVHPEHLKSRSQDLEDHYHDAGQFYWVNTKSFIENKKLFTDNSGAVVIDETLVQDIDNMTDWKLAELKYKLINE